MCVGFVLGVVKENWVILCVLLVELDVILLWDSFVQLCIVLIVEVLYLVNIDEVVENEWILVEVGKFGLVIFCFVVKDFYLINLIVCVSVLMVELLVNVKVCGEIVVVVE